MVQPDPLTRSAGLTPLVGRLAERDLLSDAVRRVAAPARDAAGSSTIALVAPAGLGKSRLVRHAVEAAHASGARVLLGRAVPSAAPSPYRPLREAVLSWVRDPGEVMGAEAEALAALLAGEPHDPAAPVSPLFVGEALVRSVSGLAASRGVVLVLEDLHWADPESLAVVEYLCDNAPTRRCAVLLTCRDDEASAAGELLRRLAARGSAALVPLGPLARDETGRLAAALVGGVPSTALIDLLHDRAEGVPLFVEELVTALRVGGALRVGDEVDVDASAAAVLPTSVADSVRARLRGLAPSERSVVEAAAILGRTVDWERLVAVVDRPEADVLAALRAATDLDLLEDNPDRAGSLRFRHALVRDAVEAAAFAPERVLLARRALDVVTGGDPAHVAADDLPLVLDLAVRCGDRPLATRMALRSAVAAFDRWALATAERRLAEARRYADTDEDRMAIDIESLRVAAVVGRVDVVERIGRGVLGRPGGVPDAAALETRLRLAQVALEDTRNDEAAVHLREAAALLDRGGDACSRTRLELYRATGARVRGDADGARRLAQRTVELARPYADQRDLVCAGFLELGRARLPDVAGAREAWTRGLAVAEADGMRLWRARLLAELASTALPDLQGDEDLELVARAAHEAGAVELAHRAAILRADLALLRGRLDDADRFLDEAADLATGTRLASHDRSRADVLRALAAAMRRSPAGGRGPVPEAVDVPCVRAALAVADDDLTGVIGDAATDGPSAPASCTAVLAVVTVLHERPAATPTGTVGRAVAAARAALAASDHEGFAAVVESLSDAPWYAAVLVRLAAPRLLDGHAAALREPVRRAVATFDDLGLAAPADACRALLRRAGVPVPRRAPDQAGVPDSLRALGVTARELDVLRLVAGGLTSREVGERLHLSPRTVEKHVERLLAKTGAPNRAALVAQFASASPTPDGLVVT